MTEKELIAKLKELRQIKPKENWVFLTKQEILKSRDQVSEGFGFGEALDWLRVIFQYKYAFSSLIVILVLFGLFGFSQNSLPGDYLYSLRKLSEKSQAVFIPEKEQSRHDLNIASRRLEDLVRVAETKSSKNLAPAINEFQASVQKAAESLAKAETEKDPKVVQEIALEIKKLEQGTEQAKSLGVVFEKEEVVEGLKQNRVYVENLISDLKTRILTEEQEEVLNTAEGLIEQKKYSEALELLLKEFNKPADDVELEEGGEEEEITEEEEAIEEDDKDDEKEGETEDAKEELR
ncbi:MAG: hypothetical protein FJZ07_01570 [Candidatus Nealsonbacteria bacterium]|nr:hypothetical protein [Candidatus Nealsonbacteria bacterium]